MNCAVAEVWCCYALGPADRRAHAGGDALGERLGTLLRDLILRSGVRRIVVAGGDTSTHAVRKIGISALTFAAPLYPARRSAGPIPRKRP